MPSMYLWNKSKWEGVSRHVCRLVDGDKGIWEDEKYWRNLGGRGTGGQILGKIKDGQMKLTDRGEKKHTKYSSDNHVINQQTNSVNWFSMEKKELSDFCAGPCRHEVIHRILNFSLTFYIQGKLSSCSWQPQLLLSHAFSWTYTSWAGALSMGLRASCYSVCLATLDYRRSFRSPPW